MDDGRRHRSSHPRSRRGAARRSVDAASDRRSRTSWPGRARLCALLASAADAAHRPPTESPRPTTCRTCCSTRCAVASSRTVIGYPSPISPPSCGSATATCAAPRRLVPPGSRWVDVAALRAARNATDDPDLIRLVSRVPAARPSSGATATPAVPGTASRSRSATTTAARCCRYEGNWRDIFQNWEALLQSFPAYYADVVAKFVNASTIDGYNPYRISRDGIDWEVPDPDDPWSHIGYWGDHQIIYLLRLLEALGAARARAISGAWLDRPMFVYADVPYRIADLRGDGSTTRSKTITFDTDARGGDRRHATQRLGADGRLRGRRRRGRCYARRRCSRSCWSRARQARQLRPGRRDLDEHAAAGVERRQQRAGRARAVDGDALPPAPLPAVRQCTARRTQATRPSRSRRRSPVGSMMCSPLEETPHPTDRRSKPALRRRRPRYRCVRTPPTCRSGNRSHALDVSIADMRRLCDLAGEHLEQSILGARRADGLYHSYNRVSFPTDDTAHVDHLGPCSRDRSRCSPRERSTRTHRWR